MNNYMAIMNNYKETTTLQGNDKQFQNNDKIQQQGETNNNKVRQATKNNKSAKEE